MARSKAVRFNTCRLDRQTIDLPFIQSLQDRTVRERSGLFWAEGCRSLHAATRSTRSISTLVVCREILRGAENWATFTRLRSAGTPVLEVSSQDFLSLSTHPEPRGVGVVVAQSWEPLINLYPSREDIWVVIDNVRTPGNLGTILRTCSAVGAQGVMLIGGETDPHDAACVRSSMGAIFSQRLIRTSAKALAGWRARHACRVIGTSPRATHHYRQVDYSGPLLLLMGNERSGLRERQLALCDRVVKLPMVGDADSLNLAVATAVILYEAIGQRTAVSPGPWAVGLEP